MDESKGFGERMNEEERASEGREIRERERRRRRRRVENDDDEKNEEERKSVSQFMVNHGMMIPTATWIICSLSLSL